MSPSHNGIFGNGCYERYFERERYFVGFALVFRGVKFKRVTAFGFFKYFCARIENKSFGRAACASAVIVTVCVGSPCVSVVYGKRCGITFGCGIIVVACRVSLNIISTCNKTVGGNIYIFAVSRGCVFISNDRTRGCGCVKNYILFTSNGIDLEIVYRVVALCHFKSGNSGSSLIIVVFGNGCFYEICACAFFDSFPCNVFTVGSKSVCINYLCAIRNMSRISGYNRRYVFAVFNIFGGNGNGVFILCFCNFKRNYGFRAVIVFGRFYIRLYKVSARRRGNVFGISAVLFGSVSKFYFAEFRICRRYVCGFTCSPSVKRKLAYRVCRLYNDKFKRKHSCVGFVRCFPFVSVFVGEF